MNIDEEKAIKKGNKLGMTILIIIAILVIISIIFIINIYKFFTSPIPKKYYVLNVTDNNKEEVLKLFKEEKENIHNKDSCDSIYKIEFYYVFPDGAEYTMYCKDEENISFSIDKSGVDTLAKYIKEKGYTIKNIIN